MQALVDEIKSYSDEAKNIQLKSVFFGGGTPSLLPGKMLQRIIEEIDATFEWTQDVERTIECNPDSATLSKLTLYRQLGFNRISFGLQSCNDDELKRIGRVHNYQAFLEAYQNARKVGFTNINIDVMSALPGQSLESYIDTLKRIIRLRPEHISSYSLILEEGTPMYNKAQSGELTFPDEELDREMYHKTKEILANAGYNRYEISNYSRSGFESRHNLIYWNEDEYIGVGLGASSYLDGVRFKNTDSFEEYFKAKGRQVRMEEQVLSIQDRIEEFMFLGLRKTAGVSKAEFYKRFKRTMESEYAQVLEKLHNQGVLVFDNDRVFLTDEGLDISNYILSEFLK